MSQEQEADDDGEKDEVESEGGEDEQAGDDVDNPKDSTVIELPMIDDVSEEEQDEEDDDDDDDPGPGPVEKKPQNQTLTDQAVAKAKQKAPAKPTATQIIYNNCMVEPEKRTEEMVDRIHDFIKQGYVISLLNIQQQRGLCQAMTVETFEAGEVVFRQGDEGDKFYVVLTGAVSVQVIISDDGRDSPGPDKVEKLAVLNAGTGFGELALQSAAPRRATIQVIVRTQLLVVSRSDYETFAGQQHRQFVDRRVEFLRNCGPISDALAKQELTREDVMALAACLSEIGVQDGQAQAVICRQGDPADRLIFVRSGQLAILRTVQAGGKERERAFSTGASHQSLASTVNNGDGEEEDDGLEDGGRCTSPVNNGDSKTDRVLKAMMAIKNQERKNLMIKLKSDKNSTIHPNEDVAKEVEVAQQKRKDGLKAAFKNAVKSVRVLNVVESICEVAKTPENCQGGETSMQHFTDVADIRRKLHDMEAKQETKARIEHNMANRKKGVEGRGMEAVRDRALHGPARGVAAPPSPRSRRIAADAVPQQGPKITRPGSMYSQMVQKLEGPVEHNHQHHHNHHHRHCSERSSPSRKRILRIGTLRAFQLWGDKFVNEGSQLPVSLVADPVAEVYEISKYDIVRKLPKRMLAVLLQGESEVQPTDGQLRDLERQTQRWYHFRRGLHAQALERSMDTPAAAAAHLNRATKNLEFLGHAAGSDLARSILEPPHQTRMKMLTKKDSEHFSDASAAFLRRSEAVRRDPEVRMAYEHAGVITRWQLHLEGIHDDTEVTEEDPRGIIFDRHWQGLDSARVGLDLEQALDANSFLNSVMSARSCPDGIPASLSLVQPDSFARAEVSAAKAMSLSPKAAGVEASTAPAATSPREKEVSKESQTLNREFQVPELDSPGSPAALRLPKLSDQVLAANSPRRDTSAALDISPISPISPARRSPKSLVEPFARSFRKPNAAHHLMDVLPRRSLVYSGRGTNGKESMSVRKGWCPLVPAP